MRTLLIASLTALVGITTPVSAQTSDRVEFSMRDCAEAHGYRDAEGAERDTIRDRCRLERLRSSDARVSDFNRLARDADRGRVDLEEIGTSIRELGELRAQIERREMAFTSRPGNIFASINTADAYQSSEVQSNVLTVD